MNKSVAIIGAGKLGTTLARLALNAGYRVYISGSGSPDKILLSMNVIAPGAEPMNNDEAIKKSNLVVLALPLSKYQTLPSKLLKDRLVIDAMNYWWETDGEDKKLHDPGSSTSELVQEFLADSRVVKALSHMGYHHLHDEARPKSSKGRKAIAIAGDDREDVDAAAKFIDDLGFDPVYLGPLSSGKLLQPGYPAFGANLTASELSEKLAQP